MAGSQGSFRCEVCEAEIASLAHVVLVCRVAKGSESPRWVIECPEEHEVPGVTYTHVKASELFAGSWETLDWLAHLAEKEWFNASDFFDCMKSMRDQRLHTS